MSDARTASELPIFLDRSAEASLPAQLTAALRGAIDAETLRPGEVVPATRTLAERLGVARGVVVTAYEQLIAEGYLLAGHGRGTRVSPDLANAFTSVRSPAGANTQASRDSVLRMTVTPSPARNSRPGGIGATPLVGPPPLAPGVPDTSEVDRPAWRTSWRHAALRAHVEAPELGDLRLRAEIAEHLRRMRGTTRLAEDVIVTAGAREGLGLLLTALGTTTGRSLVVGVEDPGYPSLRRVAARHGAQIVALPVDAEGLDTQALPVGMLDAIIVTPSHQYPLGGSLPLSRRRELLAWASRTGVVVIEDDYDSELRHTGSPLPALAALDDPAGGSVVLLGTFSKTVSQSLAAGFLLAPARLRDLIEPVRHDLGGAVSAVVQSALADYLGSGELRRHTARMRRRYALRRELVLDRLSALPGVQVRPMSGGLHAVLEFEAGGQASGIEAKVISRSTAQGLGAVPLSGYWQRHTHATERFGLVIGTGGPNGVQFARALGSLREILVDELGATN
ncbi:PLP-dependent aminotransferase family protein [Leucobacter sp. W1153]|uniref:MocR-like pyridoxine biosynthesis transcription factor PdxR n=1 Tax=Leucobacter sp. W1153 TaxID=3439064 RepID=UPI003F362AE5